jgi:hypothetical protein
MKAFKGYKQYIAWDQIASEQRIATEWCEKNGRGLSAILERMLCIRPHSNIGPDSLHT